MPHCSMPRSPPTNYHLLSAKQDPYQKVYVLTKNIEEFSEEKQKVRRTGQQKKKEDKTETAMGVGRRTRAEIGKGW